MWTLSDSLDDLLAQIKRRCVITKMDQPKRNQPVWLIQLPMRGWGAVLGPHQQLIMDHQQIPERAQGSKQTSLLGVPGAPSQENKFPPPGVSYQRPIDYGVDEYFIAHLQNETNLPASWWITSPSLVKVEGLSRVSSLPHFSMVTRGLLTPTQIGCLRPRAGPRGVTWLLFQGRYCEVSQNTQAISSSMGEKVILGANR